MPKKSGASEQENELPIRPRLVSVKEAADMLGVHVNTIRKLEMLGQLPSVRAGRILRIKIDGIDRWIAENSG
jgi:excisionase family DNA binding protein